MNLLRQMDQLLRRPAESLNGHPLTLLTGAVACYALYGAAAGFFQGGWSLALAFFKVPLIILGSLALCLPSLYIFTALAGADLPHRSFASAVAAFSGIAGLLLLALMPVIWLFSVSTVSLLFLVWLHGVTWVVSLLLARRFLARSVPSARRTITVWLILLFVVSLQMTTYLRPVLWRAPGEPLFAAVKKSFLEHFDDVADWKEPPPDKLQTLW